MDTLEELIILEIRNNNDRVLGQLYKTHYPMILNLVIKNSGTETEAKDVYQEAVIAFYERLQQKDFVLTCKIKTFLYAICKRIWLKRLSEKKRASLRIDDNEFFPGVEEEMLHLEENEKQHEMMKSSLLELGEPCRTIVQDFYIHDLTMDQIRDKFGYTNTDNAKNQKYKCMMRLKKIFHGILSKQQ